MQLVMALPAAAQETRYLYDPLGRLIGVVDQQGRLTVYDYDEVGNLLGIRRVETTTPVAITFVNPGSGFVGTSVEIFGVGFSGLPGENQIAFNGTPAEVLAATPTRLLTRVPGGASSGPITVSTPAGSAASPEPFAVPGIVISPTLTTVGLGRSRQFTATVAESPDQRVSWAVNGIEGGHPGVGTITTEGLYQAPSSELPNPPTVQIRARSVRFPVLVADALVELAPPNFAVIAMPEVRIVRPATGVNAGVTTAAPPLVSVVRPGIGEPGGVRLNVTPARPPLISVVRPGLGDPNGWALNLTLASPPSIIVVRPGIGTAGDPLNVTVAAPPSVIVVRPGTGDVDGIAPDVTVAQPNNMEIRRQ